MDVIESKELCQSQERKIKEQGKLSGLSPLTSPLNAESIEKCHQFYLGSAEA